MLSLRRLFIALIIFFVITGGVFASVSTLFFYSNSQSEATLERQHELLAIANQIFTQDTASHYYPYTVSAETLHDIVRVVASQRGARFFRIIEGDSHKILASSLPDEEGALLETLPSTHPRNVRVSSTEDSGSTLISFTYQDQSGSILWLSLDQVFFVGPTILLAIQQSFLFAVLILLIAISIYLVGNNFILKPLETVQQSLITFGKGKLTTRLPQGPPNEFGRVFNAFNSMADELQEARERDKHVSEMKSIFLSTVAHQLRTPLSGISWALSGFMAGEFGIVTKEQTTLLSDMTDKNTEIIDIVNTLLNVASIEEGKFGFVLEDTDIKEILEHLVVNMQTQRAGPHAPVTLTIQGILPHINADSARIKWTLVNILENALNYTPATGTITVKAHAQKDHVIISVSDTGIGIPQADRRRLFQKFSRGSNAIRMHSNGNGLGLFIAKNIVDYHKGKITCTSKENSGTTFTISLPRHLHTEEDPSSDPNQQPG